MELHEQPVPPKRVMEQGDTIAIELDESIPNGTEVVLNYAGDSIHCRIMARDGKDAILRVAKVVRTPTAPGSACDKP